MTFEERNGFRKIRSAQIVNTDGSLGNDSNVLIKGISHLKKNEPILLGGLLRNCYKGLPQ